MIDTAPGPEPTYPGSSSERQTMAALVKLTEHNPQQGVDPEIWVNMDLAVSMRRSGDRTRINFTAPRRPAVSGAPESVDNAPRYIEVVELPADIAAMVRRPG